MGFRLIAEILGVAAAGIASWFLRKQIARFFRWIFEGDQFFSLLETFFNEAAVLWFVFPFLDTLYQARKGDTPAPDILKTVLQSWGVALILFILAIIAKKLAKQQSDRNPQRG